MAKRLTLPIHILLTHICALLWIFTSLCPSGVFKQGKQWAFLTQGFTHGPDAASPQISPAATGTFMQVCVQFVLCVAALEWIYTRVVYN